MVQFVADIGHFKAVDDLRIGRAIGVHINGCEIIRRLDPGAGIQRDRVEQLLRIGLYRLARRCVTRSATVFSVFRHLVLPVLDVVAG